MPMLTTLVMRRPRKPRHWPFQLGLHQAGDVFAPGRLRHVRAPQGHVQGGAVFGAVDVFAPRLGLGLRQHVRFLRQVQQRGQHLGRGLLAAGVQPQAGHLELQAGVARVVAAREQFAQVGQGLGRELLQARPGDALLRGDEGLCHASGKRKSVRCR